MTYTVSLANNDRPKLVVVGCGGTGSLVAEGLCRLLINNDLTLMLVDFDRVESHNLLQV
jgi:tRNA A37 threonylcarbamoyladenosine dehydratase